jgi:hypothetical protein
LKNLTKEVIAINQVEDMTLKEGSDWVLGCLHNFNFSNVNTVSVKSAHAMWKVLMVQSCDNDILEGLAVANPPQTQNPLFFSWTDWRL